MTEKIVSTIKKRRGYMYIGHLPHGFYDKEIREYFSQFGKVRRIRLSRSKQTGNCRGYGFIEFENEKVAKIAADTMNNYLMFNKILKCQMIEKEKLHPKAFKNSTKLFCKPVKSWYRRTYNREKNDKEIQVIFSFLIHSKCFLKFIFKKKKRVPQRNSIKNSLLNKRN
jgi:nucleolar protein 15